METPCLKKIVCLLWGPEMMYDVWKAWNVCEGSFCRI